MLSGPGSDEGDSAFATGRLCPGTRFGRYTIVKRLGEGGSGAVYEASQDEPLPRRVALKVLHDVVSADPQVVARFLREAQVAARLTHPHVITMFDAGREGERLFLAMELLDGEDLDARLARSGSFELREAVDLVLPVVSAVAALHDAGVVHRDLKPENLFLTRSEPGQAHPKVLDFGIAKIVVGDGVSAVATLSLAFLGTPQYASPEQIDGARSLDGRSDQWSLAVILYQCLTGARPWPDGTVFRMLYDITRTPAEAPSRRRPELPDAFSAVLLRALEKDPFLRFPTMRDFGAALLPFASPTARVRWGDEFASPAEPAPARSESPVSAQHPRFLYAIERGLRAALASLKLRRDAPAPSRLGA